MRFPLAGIDRAMGFSAQPTKATQGAGYARTTPTGKNVRACDPATRRNRGGQRPGLAKWLATTVSSSSVTQGLNLLVSGGVTPPGGHVQTSSSGRVVTLVAVAGGNIKVMNPGDTVWTTPTGGTGAMNASGVVHSCAAFGKLYLVDGTNYKKYDPATNTVSTWTATSGTLPVDSGGNKARLICLWRGRVVLGGLLLDPHNFFMSKIGDPLDFEYEPADESPIDAISGNEAPFGKIGDVVTSFMPFSDDILVVGCDSSTWRITGDPLAGGVSDKVAEIGFAWGIPHTIDPYGVGYFFSNRTGIYALSPAQPPVRISRPIDSLLTSVDTGANTIRMLWDDRYEGLHVFVTPTAAAAAATHYYYEKQTGAWWTDVFGNNNHNPLCCCTFDGNGLADRVPLIGSWDGYVRTLDPAATTDDGTTISSEVWLGPILTKDLDDVLVRDLQAVLGTASGSVSYALHVGSSAEAALASTAVLTGTFTSGRNLVSNIRRSGYACYVKLTATAPWAMESIRIGASGLNRIRRRGK